MTTTTLNSNLYCEEDISNKNNLKLWCLACAFCLATIIIIYICVAYFQHSTDEVRTAQAINSMSVDLKTLRDKEATWLSGQESVVENNEAMAINDAMAEYAAAQKK